MVHIPHHKLLPGDLVDIFDHGPPRPTPPPPLPEDADDTQLSEHYAALTVHEATLKVWKEKHSRPVRHRMHATDAKHAMDVDPDRWKLHDGVVTIREVGDDAHEATNV